MFCRLQKLFNQRQIFTVCDIDFFQGFTAIIWKSTKKEGVSKREDKFQGYLCIIMIY